MSDTITLPSSLLVRLLLRNNANTCLDTKHYELCSDEELQMLVELLKTKQSELRGVFHYEYLAPTFGDNGMRLNDSGELDDPIHLIWNAKDWETHLRKHLQSKLESDSRVDEWNRKEAKLKELIAAIIDKLGVDIELAKPLAVSMITKGQKMQIKAMYGVDI